MQCLSNKQSVKRLKKIIFINIYLLFDILLGLQLIAFKFRLYFDASHVNAFKGPRLLNRWSCGDVRVSLINCIVITVFIFLYNFVVTDCVCPFKKGFQSWYF